MNARREPDSPWAQSLRLAFRFMFLIVFLLGAGWFASNLRVIPTDSRAVVLRFGSVARVSGPGLLFAFPQPVERVIVLPSADRQNQHIVTTLAAQSGVLRDPRLNAGLLLSGDMSVVHLSATLFYRIVDARAYVLSSDHVEPALDRLFMASAVAVCGSRDLDTMLVARPELETAEGSARAGRERFRVDLANAINARLADLERQGAGLGVTIERVDLWPSIPQDAKAAFDSVTVAIQGAETAVANARTAAEKTAQQADQKKDRLVADAQAQAAEHVTTARARTAAIAALAAGAPGLRGPALARQIYADRIGPLLGKAAAVQTTNGEPRLILSGSSAP
ncbi:SPFH domain-containing protein [Solimonas soli]|uniref:SPFH domain-containing protein n=1 Tax=Solimonas soli TaxID=413479 RepID=UPI00048591FE|nr:SPFH domain-containing protein [Solimonas soli]